jgi:putative acetyltransferase
VTIRPFQDADAESVRSLIADVYAEYGCSFVDEEETHLADPSTFFRARGGDFWVAEDDCGVAGSVAVWFAEEAEAELKSLYVRRDRRGSGLGERLVHLALDHSRQAGKRSVRLWTDTRFERAHRLYDRLGFERFGERELGDFNQSREYGMRLSLE